MRFTSSTVAYATLLSLSALSAAQQMLDFSQGALPACAQQCSTLQMAQTGCIPAGGAPVSTPQTYKSCFCQSALLSQLKTGTDTTVCNDLCQAADLQAIATWYTNYCNSNALPSADSGNNNNNGGAQPTTAATTGAPAATNAPTSTDSTNDGDGVAPRPNRGTWWDNHGKWIAMVIVLLVGFGVIIAVSLWYKKRYYRRRAATLTEPTGWNPHESGNYGYYPGSTEKVMGGVSRNEAASPAPVQQHGRGGSMHKLSKLVGR